MNFSEDFIDGLEVMGFLHDIGKIIVPAEILSKPGALNEFEFNIIKAHAEAGYNILKGIEFPWPVATVKDAMETYAPNGQLIKQPQNAKTAFEGPVAIYEVVAGTANKTLIKAIEAGAVFNATAYHGRPNNYTEKRRIKGAFLVMDVADRDWENDTALLLQGTLHFHWFAGIED